MANRPGDFACKRAPLALADAIAMENREFSVAAGALVTFC
jgi:hypothetical protein